MHETVGVIILGLGFALTVPIFVLAAMFIFRRKAPRQTVTIYRRYPPRQRSTSAEPRRLH